MTSNTIQIRKADPNTIAVEFRYSPAIVAVMRGLPGAKYQPAEKRWHVPNSLLATLSAAMSGFMCEYHDGLTPPAEEILPPEDIDTADVESFAFKLKPFSHQLKAMALGVRAKRYAYLMEMGTGKTKTAIDTVNFWIEHRQVNCCLVIAPKAVLYSWKREIEENSLDRRVCVITGTADEKRATLRVNRDTCEFFITNYATLRDVEMETFLSRLVSQRHAAIVFDESANIASYKSAQSKAAQRISRCTDHKLILNGTPIANSPLDAFGQFYVLDPSILGHRNFTTFKNEFAITGGFKGKEIIGFKNLERLKERMNGASYRVLKKDCLDLPDKLYRVVELPVPPRMATAYKQLRDEAVLEQAGVTVAVPLVLTRLMRLQQITSGYLPAEDEYGNELEPILFEEDKLNAAIELVEEAVANGQKVIIWSRFLRDVKQAAEKLAHLGARAYHGQVKDEERQAAVDAFQNDPTCRVFVGQSHTGGIGITLTAASVEIYLANSFSYLDRAQSEDRAHRIGQKNNVSIIDIVMKGTVDEYLLKCLKDKKDIASLVTGDNLRELLNGI